MPPAGFEPAIPASERSRTHALDPPSTGIGIFLLLTTDLILLYHICILLESLNNTTIRRARSPTTIRWEAIVTKINDDPDRTNRVEPNTARAHCFSPQSATIRGRG